VTVWSGASFPASGSLSEKPQKTMSHRTCLIVDDEPSIRSLLDTILGQQHLRCLEAGNVSQAMRIVQKLGGRLDLIISDIRMPGDMDGLDLAYAVRNEFPEIPIILISGYADEHRIKNADVCFELISKPFVSERLLNAVKRALDRAGTQTAVAAGP
jgi:DNA-binding NtrC family response regulator